MGKLKEMLLNAQPLDPVMTLDDAVKGWKVTIADKGGYCPCCGKWGKVYRQKLSEAMVKSLLWMASNHGEDWIDMPRQAPRWVIQTYTFATMHWWHLIERMPMTEGVAVGEDGVGQEKKFSGYWRVTTKGMQFARGLIQMPKYIYVYDNKYMDASTETIYIRHCFGEEFNYDEVMSTTWTDGNYQ